MSDVQIRPIELKDNKELADLIRGVFREFKIDKPGTVYTDPTTDHLYELFQKHKSFYFVAEESGMILGGCGIYPTKGLPEGCVELVKFYLASSARGKGVGNKLMQTSFKKAKEFGFHQLYLESFPELSKAVSMYKREGFRDLDHPLGNTGHFACNLWMIKDL
ncbi:MAG: acetyltransferase [Bacteroidetes bacterium]|nr:acetyltransferase [Bacteroidota bacterium]